METTYFATHLFIHQTFTKRLPNTYSISGTGKTLGIQQCVKHYPELEKITVVEPKLTANEMNLTRVGRGRVKSEWCGNTWDRGLFY